MYDPDELKRDIEKIRKSGYFDPDWYRATYKDVDMLGMDPAEHYLRFGAMMRRDPGPDFSTSFYLDTRNRIADTNLNPLIHYIENRVTKAGKPNIKKILKAADSLANRGFQEKAIKFSESLLPPELQHSVSILKANKAIAFGNEASWLSYVNEYLNHFGLVSLRLAQCAGSIFDRLHAQSSEIVSDGPLVSIIMPAWNAEKTIHFSVTSILEQTWRNIELFVVDDQSTDKTWTILQGMAQKDSRLRIFRNSRNVGPYVSKNRALRYISGEYITGHDADDWAHPQRIENHVKYMEQEKGRIEASVARMIRMRWNGQITNIRHCSQERIDGAMQLASISCMFRAEFFKSVLGSWDCVRFSADSELIARAELVLGWRLKRIDQLGMFCLDTETSLTNHPEFGIDRLKGISGPRLEYRKNYEAWHSENIKANKNSMSAFLPFPQSSPRFDTPQIAMVDPNDIAEVLMEDAG